MSGLRSALSNQYLVLLARMLLGGVLLVAAIDKTADPAAFAASIDNYKIVAHSTSLVIATVLPWLELLCAFAFLFGVSVRGSAMLTFVMIAVFTIAVCTALVRGLDISCGCFTQDPSAQKIGWTKVAENLGLIALSGYLLFSDGNRFSLEHYQRSRSLLVVLAMIAGLPYANL